RDLATNPPDRVAVRVIAKIMREMKVSQTGQMITTALDDVWVIRSKSYEFRVAPLSENPDMLVIQPENSDLSFQPDDTASCSRGRPTISASQGRSWIPLTVSSVSKE